MKSRRLSQRRTRADLAQRDLKLSNIRITPNGVAKVLDFGLAKLTDSNVSSTPNAISMSPTIMVPSMMTGAGVILGTAAYMAPEQAKDRAADKRSDIWAFGCVLFEMLSGKRDAPYFPMTGTRRYDVTSDGQRFLFIKNNADRSALSVLIALGIVSIVLIACGILLEAKSR